MGMSACYGYCDDHYSLVAGYSILIRVLDFLGDGWNLEGDG